ncbi:glycosyltransferase [Streptosporangium sp. DT93]|uniref:glycosyltransferase n=1 Tax=Streptosporangium sp. DT93 TaxID=3393428 RepID=UPI003CF0A7F6
MTPAPPVPPGTSEAPLAPDAAGRPATPEAASPVTPAAPPPPSATSSPPVAGPDFRHLERLSDDTGLFEHARNAVVRRQHGYCTDDVARGLVVTSRERAPSPGVHRLAECYLAFLTHAQDDTGAFRNRLSHDRRWSDEPGLGDWWGRALWGLGTAAARNPAAWIRDEALITFTLGASRRSSHPRAMVFAGLGAAEVLRVRPGDGPATALLADAALAVGLPPEDPGASGTPGTPGDPAWPWPQPELTYANAALAEVLVSAGHLLGDGRTLAAGLRMLAWLGETQTTAGRFSVVPVTGWRRHGPRDRYDQQPIELAALADAFATAGDVTGDPAWRAGVWRAVAWFRGANDRGAVMWDPATGGGYDGLTPYGPNLNQGAESTIALISTMQHAERLREAGHSPGTEHPPEADRPPEAGFPRQGGRPRRGEPAPGPEDPGRPGRPGRAARTGLAGLAGEPPPGRAGAS